MKPGGDTSPGGGILALDLATITGWAWRAAGMSSPRCGAWNLAGRTHAAGYAVLCDYLADAITLHAPRLIVYEAPLPPPKQTHANTARFLLGLCAVVELVAYRRDVPVREASRQTACAKVVGNGRATKDDVMAWARGRGFTPPTHDAADALVLLEYAERHCPHLRWALEPMIAAIEAEMKKPAET